MSCAGYVTTLAALVFVASYAVAQHPGHLKPLGSNQPSSGHIDILDTVPSAREFWEKYASKGEPLLLRGAANHSSARHLWTDEYFLEHYGNLEVKMEGKVEKGGSVPVSEVGAGRMTIREFLRRYKAEDAYVVSQLPQPMYREISVPPCLMCGTFKRRILEVNLWFSSGGTKSLLHRDADNAINCLLAGRKDWILIDRKYTELVPLATEPDGAFGAFALLDVDRVNLKKYPQLIGLPWRHANVMAGDCLYLPYSYLHQVRSYERNIAVSILFARLEEYDDDGCDDESIDFTPLDHVNVTWSYSGHGKMSMGNADPEHVRMALRQYADKNEGMLSKELFQQGLVEERDLTEEEAMEAVHKVFEKFGEDGRVLSESAISQLSENDLKTIAGWTTLEEEDDANTYEYEDTLFDKEAVKMFVAALVKPDTQVTSEEFVDKWIDFGGSSRRGFKLFSAIDVAAKGYITTYDLSKAGDKPYESFGYGKTDKGNREYHEEMSELEKEVLNESVEDNLKAVHEELHEEL